MEWWTHDHKEMEHKHGNEDHGDQALGDAQGVKRSRQRYNIGFCFCQSKMSRELIDRV